MAAIYTYETGDEITVGLQSHLEPRTGAEPTARTSDAWWRWHDADSSRWSATDEEADQRCEAWVAGDSDDGPQDE